MLSYVIYCSENPFEFIPELRLHEYLELSYSNWIPERTFPFNMANHKMWGIDVLEGSTKEIASNQLGQESLK